MVHMMNINTTAAGLWECQMPRWYYSLSASSFPSIHHGPWSWYLHHPHHHHHLLFLPSDCPSSWKVGWGKILHVHGIWGFWRRQNSVSIVLIPTKDIMGVECAIWHETFWYWFCWDYVRRWGGAPLEDPEFLWFWRLVYIEVIEGDVHRVLFVAKQEDLHPLGSTKKLLLDERKLCAKLKLQSTKTIFLNVFGCVRMWLDVSCKHIQPHR